MCTSENLSEPLLEGDLRDLAAAAWRVRENSYLEGRTAVGCAVLTADGRTFVGCNVEHKFRSHDVHAEVNAIGTMVAGGARRLRAIIIVAERQFFTPCGACMDWIMQFGSGETVIAFQRRPDGEFRVFSAKDLMPYYPW